MFALALIIGIYAYGIYTLGLLGLLFKQYILLLSVITLLFSISYFGKYIQSVKLSLLKRKYKSFFKKNRSLLIKLLIIAVVLQSVINLLGALGPELSFDALWYHLTLPKIFLEKHTIFHIPGGLLYYSDMPKLTEMLYIPALAFGNEITAKLIHFLFGILILIAIYKFISKHYSFYITLFAIVIFYSNLVVSWESTTAFVDLARAFFELMALWGFMNYLKLKKKIWLVESAIILGLAISSKLLSILSISIFIILLFIYSGKINHKYSEKIKDILVYLFFSVMVPLPWLLFSYINTGNPFYPFSTNVIKYNQDFSLIFQLFNPLNFVKDIFFLFTKSNDPISPIYLITFPIIVFIWKTMKPESKIISVYSLLSLIIWYLTPRIGGGRFMLAYLPALSILSAIVINEVKGKSIKNILVCIVILTSFSSIVYRSVANAKFIPYLVGRQTKQEFLAKYLNYSFGGFYDIDGYFKNNIKNTDKVLILGMHNLYYVDFPFIHETWVKSGDEFNFILLQNADLPERFKRWRLIYINDKTRVKLYSFGGQNWIY